MHKLCGPLTVPFVPVRVTCCSRRVILGAFGALVFHRYSYTPPRMMTIAVPLDFDTSLCISMKRSW